MNWNGSAWTVKTQLAEGNTVLAALAACRSSGFGAVALVGEPRLPGERAASMAGAQVPAGVHGAQRAGCGHADDGYAAAGSGLPGGSDGAQGQDFRSAEVLGAA